MLSIDQISVLGITVVISCLIVFRLFRNGLEKRRQKKRSGIEKIRVEAEATARLAEFPPNEIFVARPENRGLRFLITVPLAAAGVGLVAALKFGWNHSSAITLALVALGLLGVMAYFRVRGAAKRLISIDVGQAIAEFTNFTFVASFTGNPIAESRVIPFADILSVNLLTTHGTSILDVRTRQGKVLIGDEMQPFDELTALLRGAAAMNRELADDYRETVSRAPRRTISWIDLLWILAVLAAVGVYYWLSIQQHWPFHRN